MISDTLTSYSASLLNILRWVSSRIYPIWRISFRMPLINEQQLEQVEPFLVELEVTALSS
jgi:hypothetical protein